jgi:hypothetical protein
MPYEETSEWRRSGENCIDVLLPNDRLASPYSKGQPAYLRIGHEKPLRTESDQARRMQDAMFSGERIQNSHIGWDFGQE